MTADASRRLEHAQALRELGHGYKVIARELGVSDTTVRRLIVPGFAERMRRLSREAKRRRTGRCERCGGVTRYNGHGRSVSQLCRACGARAGAEYAETLRGTGTLARAILDAVDGEPRRFMELCQIVDRTPNQIGVTLDRLLKYGLVEQPERGVYIRAREEP
jgi:hypothetical protein